MSADPAPRAQEPAPSRRAPGAVLPLQALAAGAGDPVVLLHAFALSPVVYQPTIDLLARANRVVVPWWLHTTDRTWTLDVTIAGLARLLDALGLARVTLVGHSFGGAIALAFADRAPERVSDLVLVDALAAAPSRRELARLALPGRHLLTLASWAGARAFFGTAIAHPRSVRRAGWWGFACDLWPEAERVAASGVRTSVLWARDDSVLPVAWGAALADALGARFVAVGAGADGRRVDHDWVFRRPARFAATLRDLGLARSVV